MYFEKSGVVNTESTVQMALKAAEEKGIKHIVVASVSGKTAMILAEQDRINVVCVSHAYGYRESGTNEMKDSVREHLERKNIKVITASHVLSGVERGISNHSKGMYPAEVMSYTLRMFGQGVKVCVEVVTMALDAGAIPYGEDIIAIGGTVQGVDTAVVIRPAHANRIFETQIKEIICKPYQP